LGERYRGREDLAAVELDGVAVDVVFGDLQACVGSRVDRRGVVERVVRLHVCPVVQLSSLS
jgi:hypothetical protein